MTALVQAGLEVLLLFAVIRLANTADEALSGLYTFAVSDIVICGNSKYPFASVVGSKMPTTTTIAFP